MKKQRFKALLLLLSAFLVSCATDFNMDFPKGPKGDNGSSAYELWVEGVKDGSIEWDKENTGINYFFLYMKGQDGADGADGQSAHDLWKIEVEKGLDDPHNPGTEWDKEKTELSDFFNYLTGADGIDGLSAYELWKIDVVFGLENPHEPGTNWPTDKTEMTDFWEYLRGGDGKDGDPGLPGAPGETVEIEVGIPNVIAAYSVQSHNEYVRWEDGGVAYHVYNKRGGLAANAVVKGLPGINDPDKEYTADDNGVFIVPKEDLPLDLPYAQRHGSTAMVSYTDSTEGDVAEPTAGNTYVPNRIQVRIRVTSTPGNPHSLTIPFVIERKTSSSLDWEKIPTYLGSLNQYIRCYELSDENDINSFTPSSKKHYDLQHSISTVSSINVGRLVKRCEYLTESYQVNSARLWDGNDHYINLVMESYYGESPIADMIVKLAPTQFMPLITDVEAADYDSSTGLFMGGITGRFDTSNIDYDLFFEGLCGSEDRTDYTYYYPVKMEQERVDVVKIFKISLSKNLPGGEVFSVSNTNNASTMAAPEFGIVSPFHMGSDVSVSTVTQQFFLTPNKIGVLTYDEATSEYYIRNSNTNYIIPDIPVTVN